MPGLLLHGDFTLHSGRASNFKIDCDALSDEDLATAAWFISLRCSPFGRVSWIPTGGTRLAQALEPHITPGVDNVLLVDDVWTTGDSMRRARLDIEGDVDVEGWVLFARSALPWWCRAMFKLDSW